MTIATCSESMMQSEKAVRTCALTEIVRGSDNHLMDEMTPLVRRQDIILDMSPVERVDAAGIAALISLYRLAEESGHRFKVTNVAPRVYELLALSGSRRSSSRTSPTWQNPVAGSRKTPPDRGSQRSIPVPVWPVSASRNPLLTVSDREKHVIS